MGTTFYRLRARPAEKIPRARIALSRLSAIERARLKEAFRIIRSWQERAAFHYKTDF